ncbi:MAG TPA: alpha-N-arabinofuranosidase, partial [Chitinophagaceae bacterium]|nr:alpha-N-arabinofuranosidase [Chitinophagaceae bacterium]
MKRKHFFIGLSMVAIVGCNSQTEETKTEPTTELKPQQKKEYVSQPLVSHIYTADPSAHVFNNRIYIYPSHDTATGTKEDDLGGHFDMRDYHVLSMDSIGGPVTDHGVALDIKNVPWAGRQMWAPDATFANGEYYFYFPVKNKQDV